MRIDSEHTVWFWQRIVSPHMANLAEALAFLGCNVVLVAEESMSKDRVELGWSAPELSGVRVEFAATVEAVSALIDAAPAHVTHVCQGVRANGVVAEVQRRLAERRLRYWVVMETVDDNGWRGVLKRLEYRRLFLLMRHRVEGVLANGYRTSEWLARRGVPRQKIFDFSYFLSDEDAAALPERAEAFRFVFVGQFIERKRLDLLIDALSALTHQQYEFCVIGSGPLEEELRARAEAQLPGRVRWVGRLPAHEVPLAIAGSDCLVLPSRHDGWGAVVSEALMVGTPAVCSDTCGAAGVVLASGHGGVFSSGDVRGLSVLLGEILRKGRLSKTARTGLAEWAQCLGARAGARYLLEILESRRLGGAKPTPPWLKSSLKCVVDERAETVE